MLSWGSVYTDSTANAGQAALGNLHSNAELGLTSSLVGQTPCDPHVLTFDHFNRELKV
jgi:hypothetical protein